MKIRPPSFDRLVEALGKFPTIGPKTATRIALWLLNKPISVSEEIADALVEARKAIRRCAVCHQYSESDLCAICSDPSRDRSIICVVEEAVDVWNFEKTGRFNGVYHVLGGAISPLDGIGPENLTISALFDRLTNSSRGVKEVILATDPDTEGNATSLFIAAQAPVTDILFTRLAHGIPVGGELAYSDEATLGEALIGRRSL